MPDHSGPSRDYHDYFIKDGRFIGRFEEMYQNVDDPWHIDRLGRRIDMDAALLLVESANRPCRRVLDAGCGKGLFTSLLHQKTQAHIWACDVSATAVAQARDRYKSPDIEFFTFDLNRPDALPFDPGFFDLIAMAQTMWCVLPALEEIFKVFARLLRPGGTLLLSQHFLQPGQQKYGADIMAGPEDLIRLVEKAGFQIKATLETDRLTNHHLALAAEPGGPK